MKGVSVNPETRHIAEAELNEYLDGTLDAQKNEAVTQHLAGCTQCQAQAAELSLVFATLAAMPDASLTRDLSAQILAELPPAGVVRWPAWVRPLLVVQVALASALLLWLWPRLAPGWTAFVKTGQGVGASITAGLQSRFALLELADLLPTGALANFPAGPGMELVLPVAQLVFLAALALGAWFLGNALLLSRNRQLEMDG